MEKTFTNDKLSVLLKTARSCDVCKKYLPLGPRPIVQAKATSRILIIGQAPGTIVHKTGIPWDDASGKRLRAWMGIDDETFYDERRIAIMPMGFCYPGKGPSGDLPPRPECAPLWHAKLMAAMPNIQLTLLIGQYAHAYYLGEQRKPTLTETVKNFKSYGLNFFPLVHPSPRNQIWLKKNPWFEKSVVPHLQVRVAKILAP